MAASDGRDDSPAGNTLVELNGGLELLSSPISAPRGTCYDMLNFESDQGPGYAPSPGWARYDGRIQGPTLDDFWIAEFGAASWNSLSGIYGETVTLTYGGGYFYQVLLIGFIAPGGSFGVNGALIFAYPPLRPNIQNDPRAAPFSQAQGALSGMNITPIGATWDIATGNYNDAQYTLFLKAIQTQHSASVHTVPGQIYTPPDSAFFYKGQAYCTHDCIVLGFTAGGQAAGTQTGLLEGHILKNAGSIFIGKVLSVTLTSGAWDAGNVAGNVVIYDSAVNPLTFLSNGDVLTAFKADNSGAVSPAITIIYSSVVSLLYTTSPFPGQRSLLYTTPEQITGYYHIQGSNTSQWTRVPFTRELPYTQALLGHTTGAGFGPIGTAPYSIYEYTRSGLTSVIAQLTPPTTADIIGNSTSLGNGWTNLANIFVQDGAVASSPSTAANRLVAGVAVQGFANAAVFTAIPAGSAIVGLQCRIRMSSSVANAMRDSFVQICTGTPPAFALHALNKGTSAAIPAALTDFVYGGPTDLWGEQLTLATLQDPTFGIFIQATNRGVGAAILNIDCIVLQVTYVPPSRSVFLRNTFAGVAATDVPVNILHYTTDGNTSFSGGNATGTLTVNFGPVESAGTQAGKSRPVGAQEEIWTGAGGTGSLLGYTGGGDYPITYPGGNLIDAQEAKWEWIRFNFYSDPTAEMAFGVNGTEFANMFDGTYMVRIRTGRQPQFDNPRHVTAFAGALNLGFNSGDIITTATGRPVTVDGLLDSQAFNVGEPITALHSINGQTLFVGTEKSIRGFQGTDPSNYVPLLISPDLNCLEYTFAPVAGTPVWCSYRGFETLDTTNAYGSFETRALSAEASPFLVPRLSGDSRIGKSNVRPVYAWGNRTKKQYCVGFADGYVAKMTLRGGDQTPMISIQRLRRDNAAAGNLNAPPFDAAVLRHAFAGVRTDGSEILLGTFENQNFQLIGAAAYFPYVIAINGARTCDADLYMNSYIDINPVYVGYPTQEQQFQTMTVWLQGLPNTVVTVYSEFDIDGPMLVNAIGLANRLPASRTFTIPYPGNQDKITSWITVPLSNIISECDVTGYGRSIHLRFDTSGTNCYVRPRFTHLALVTEKQRVKGT